MEDFCCCCCSDAQQKQQTSHQVPASPPPPSTAVPTSQTMEHHPETTEVVALSSAPVVVDAPREEEIAVAAAATDEQPSTSSKATLKAPSQATAGSTINVEWTGPCDSGDFIGVSKRNVDGYIHYSYVYKDSNDATVKLLLPAESGDYEIKYMQDTSDRVLARRSIQLVAPQAALNAPQTAVAGSTIQVDWEGPNNDGDYIAISQANMDGYLHYTYLYGNHPVQLLVPAEPGLYDIKYMMERHNDKVLATKQITLTGAVAFIEAPETAVAGSTIAVKWSGPGQAGDYIGISRLHENGYLQYAYLQANNPVVQLLTPPDAGQYEVKYMLERHNDKVLTRRAITLQAATASIQAPATAVAGSTIDVQWTGPGYNGDFLGISKADEDGYIDYLYFHNSNSPMRFTVPNEPGEYDLKYMMEAHDNKVLTKHRIRSEPKTK